MAVEWSGNPYDPNDPFYNGMRMAHRLQNVAKRVKRKLMNYVLFYLPPSCCAKRLSWPKGI